MQIETKDRRSSDAYHYSQIEKAIQYLETHVTEQPGLEELAHAVHLSPFHLQRIFTEWAGISPKRFLQYLTTDVLKEKMVHSRNLIEAADEAGLSSQSRVYDLFVNLEAVTPQEYKEKGKGLIIEFGFHSTPFGECLIATTSRGICGLSFVIQGSNQEALDELSENWEHATFRKNTHATEKIVQEIFAEAGTRKRFNLLVRGTNFQIKVWEALLKIPSGKVSSYQDIATAINQPMALQAVGSAIGHNPVAYLIPCHRVIRKQGESGEYRWGKTRKKSMIAYEMSKSA